MGAASPKILLVGMNVFVTEIGGSNIQRTVCLKFSRERAVSKGLVMQFHGYPFVFSCLCFRLGNRDVRNDQEKVFKEII